MTRLAQVINLENCIGCQTCVHSCKMQNNVPMGLTWNRVLSDGEDVLDGASGAFPNLSRTYLPVACQHCQIASCPRGCPTGATYRDDEGRVLVDYSKCIGCRMCMAACPYNARVFNWHEPVRDPDFNYGGKDVPVRPKGVVEKCTLCKERAAEGKEPMCVQNCPTKARTYGDLDDPNSEASKLVREHKAYVLLEEQGNNPSLHYFD